MTDADGNIVPFSNAKRSEKRQVDAASPAMTDADGNIVPFSNALLKKTKLKLKARAEGRA